MKANNRAKFLLCSQTTLTETRQFCAAVLNLLFCRPEVEFNIRLLKAVQLMEFPLLKSWVANLVNDCLKLCKWLYSKRLNLKSLANHLYVHMHSPL